jgi:catechol 2,3-dioxygenase-like lactoylglutathione lyase family enzyme
MPTRARVLSTTPLLVVSDLRRSLDFYCNKLGFGQPSVHGDPPCFAMLGRDGFELRLSVAGGEARVQPNGPSGTWDVYVRVDDVAAEQKALAAAGVPLAKGPTDLFYGMREIEVLDPDGHRLCFGQDVG